MVQRQLTSTAAWYETDETGWLEQTAELIRQGQLDAVDLQSLAEYLTDMAKRDRREVSSRLVALLMHLLKWEYQPGLRTGSWQSTILEQQRELREILASHTLRNHATAVFAKAYQNAREQAAAETGLPRATFPEECAWDLEGILADRGN